MTDSNTKEKTSADSSKKQTTFGLVKPEAFDRGLVDEIERRIVDSGLSIVDKKVLVMDEHQLDAVYGHVKSKKPEMYELLKAQMRRPVELLIVEGDNAVERLLKIRGSSDPKDAAPGTIRGDFAKDQAYDQRGTKVSLNVFHAADSVEDVDRMMSAFSNSLIKKDYFYSESTGLNVSRKPLKIDARVKEAAERSGIKVDWNDEGIINNIRFDEAKKLMEALGSKMLSPDEYWKVLNDALVAKDKEMVKELTSDKYTEWLDRVYFFDAYSDKIFYINHPKVMGNLEYAGEKKMVTCPIGRPGWFNPENNINLETGEPIHLEQKRDKFSTSWKFWSPDVGLLAGNRKATAPIRGYVTSVGKPSLDLGIPVDSRQPNSMMRECRDSLLETEIDSSVLGRAEQLVKSQDADKITEFIGTHGKLFSTSYDSQVHRLRENFFDLLGYASLNSNVKQATDQLCEMQNKQLSYDAFGEFLNNSRNRLEKALEKGKDIVFVMGHKNPDTDTVISSMFEAWRNHLVNGDKVAYVPIVQSDRLPREVSTLLGELSQSALFSTDILYKKAKSSGLARWISVDQNMEPEVQKYFISIIDHHAVSDFAVQRDVPKTLEPLGSCCALVALKYLGMGLSFDSETAKLIYGATLMDTENRTEHKMTKKDVELMDYLKKVSGIDDDNKFYRRLMSQLLETDDAGLLFNRDYKEDWGFGFSVAKTKHCFSKEGVLLKEGIVSELCSLAAKNNRDKNFLITLLRIVDYNEDNETVNRERIYFVFNDKASENFKKAVKETLEGIVHFELPDDSVRAEADYIDLWGSGKQLSRKSTAPILEPVVSAFNRYFYSPTIERWVKRDFLKYTGEVKAVMEDASVDEQNRINNVTFGEAKMIVQKLSLEMQSASEYWKVLDDARKANDAQMLESLQGSNFLEFWDTAIIKKRILIEHPEIKQGKILGVQKEVNVPEGAPGLIHPKEIDRDTGIPKIVRSPNDYGNSDLWRYWAPDSDEVFPCRSYIFLLKQPSWDGKFHMDDSFPKLGIRPVAKTVKDPIVTSHWDSSTFVLEIDVEGDKNAYSWPKR